MEIICEIESFLEQMSENIQQMYHGLKSKKKEALIKILQEVRCLFSEENETDNCDFVGNSGIIIEESNWKVAVGECMIKSFTMITLTLIKITN